LIEGAAEGAGLGIRFLKHLSRTRLLLHLVDMAPLDGSDPLEAVRVILGELEKFSPALMQRERWLVLNKADQLLDEERDAKVKSLLEDLGWTGKVFVISALQREGTDALCQAIMRHLDERELRRAEEPGYAEALDQLDERIENEARERLQILDDQRAARRRQATSEIKKDDDEGEAEVFYVQ